MHDYMNEYMYVCKCMYVYVRMYMYVCICMYVHVCMHVYTLFCSSFVSNRSILNLRESIAFFILTVNFRYSESKSEE